MRGWGLGRDGEHIWKCRPCQGLRACRLEGRIMRRVSLLKTPPCAASACCCESRSTKSELLGDVHEAEAVVGVVSPVVSPAGPLRWPPAASGMLVRRFSPPKAKELRRLLTAGTRTSTGRPRSLSAPRSASRRLAAVTCAGPGEGGGRGRGAGAEGQRGEAARGC